MEDSPCFLPQQLTLDVFDSNRAALQDADSNASVVPSRQHGGAVGLVLARSVGRGLVADRAQHEVRSHRLDGLGGESIKPAVVGGFEDVAVESCGSGGIDVVIPCFLRE